jgi:hypothetical protein
LQEDREVVVLKEGEECDEFWNILGTNFQRNFLLNELNFSDSIEGREEYAKGGYLEKGDFTPKLFFCSEASGTFEVEEDKEFNDEDLRTRERECVILDCGDEMYVRIGAESSPVLKKTTLQTALQYSQKKSNTQIPVSHSVIPFTAF